MTSCSPTLILVLGLALFPVARAELRLPAIIGDHMVLQQNLANPIWGWDTPGTGITVTFAGRTESATAGADGRWSVKLAPALANATPQTLVIAGTTKREIQDVLVGEVWMCSGQSNMGFKLKFDWNGDLEAAATHLPGLRLLSVPNVGTQELQDDFKGRWREAAPDTALEFSAVGFLFGRYLHEILGVPVGLIDNAWGGSTAEAWIRRETLEHEPRFQPLMASTALTEAYLQSPAGREAHQRALANWDAAKAGTGAAGRPLPRRPVDYLTAQKRPGNIFAGVVRPTLGYGLKGVIWYQGEANAERAVEYRELFPFLIGQWRREWGQGDFPFYWVQLPNYQARRPEPGDSDWAELREAQTLAQALPNTGQAVTIDLGEGSDIHPRHKYEVAARLVRWALARDYGQKLPYRGPEYRTLTVAGGKATVALDCFGGSLRTIGANEVRGFALCGEDKVWHWAQARIVPPDRVEVWSEAVTAPVAVRYAWAGNPDCNLYSDAGLPVTPFRTDNFKLTTDSKAEPIMLISGPPDPRRFDWFYNPFSADSAHHRPIGTGAKYASAADPAVEAFQKADGFNINVGYTPWGCGIWEAKPTDPLFAVDFFRGDDGSRPKEFPVMCRLPLDMVMLQKRNRSGNFDGVLVVYDRAADTIHHFRQFNWNTEKPTPEAKPTASSHKTWSIRGLGHGVKLGEPIGTSASGVAAMFGILRGWEVKAVGHPIGHALQMVLPRTPSHLQGRIMLGREVWWPAVSMDGSAYPNPAHNTGHVPYGSLWAIPPIERGGPDLTKLGLSEKGLRLAECIRDYGLYAVDGGGTTAIRADQDFDAGLAGELKAETAKFYRYIRLVTNSVPEEGKVKFNVGDTPTHPTGGGAQQLVAGAFPAGGGEPLAPNTTIAQP